MSRFQLHYLILAGLLLGGVGAGWATAGEHPQDRPVKPRRVVSLNMCADQIVLALADRGQIAGLTRNANKPELSAAAAQTRGLRILGTSAEEVLEIDPDLIVGMPARRGAALSGIADRGYRMLDLKSAESFADIEASVRSGASALGHPDRGEAMLARMRGELSDIPRNGRGRVAAYYQRRGFLTGTGTLIDDLMNRAGLVNLAGKLGKPPLSQLSLEELVAAKPDFLIVESATDQVVDQGTEMLHHPAIADIPRISIPQAWTVCGGPAYVQAARGISAQIAAHDRRRQAR
jgi:iron complex transport system substrate-binding protein